MAQQANLAVASVRVGGRDYPVVSQRNCRTCCSPHRVDVEQQALTGRTWKAISDSLPPTPG